MTKKETIIKAWIDLGIKTPFGICDNSGYFHSYFCNGLDEILEGFGIKENQIDYDLDFNGVGKFRPISLKGIEDNNGWTKIESIEDLPKEKGFYLFLSGIGHTTYGIEDVKYAPDWFAKKYTHWKLKQEFLNPLY